MKNISNIETSMVIGASLDAECVCESSLEDGYGKWSLEMSHYVYGQTLSHNDEENLFKTACTAWKGALNNQLSADSGIEYNCQLRISEFVSKSKDHPVIVI